MKSKEMEKTLNKLTKSLFGRERTFKQCVTCGSSKIDRTDFRDNLSWKEFHISCMCQVCQDTVFTEPSIFEEEDGDQDGEVPRESDKE